MINLIELQEKLTSLLPSTSGSVYNIRARITSGGTWYNSGSPDVDEDKIIIMGTWLFKKPFKKTQEVNTYMGAVLDDGVYFLCDTYFEGREVVEKIFTDLGLKDGMKNEEEYIKQIAYEKEQYQNKN